MAGAAKPDDLAAIQVSQGSDWILAKVISHDPNTARLTHWDWEMRTGSESATIFFSLSLLPSSYPLSSCALYPWGWRNVSIGD